MRLNKYLAHSGVAARRKADELIISGRVQVGGRKVTTPGIEIAEDDLVEVDGHPVELMEEKVVYLLHKPVGLISSVTDPRGRPTVVDIINDGRRLFPVGRLDRDTTGALLITNDGELANLLTHPRYGVEKHYLAEVKGRLNSRTLAQLGKGITINGGLNIKTRIEQAARSRGQTRYRLTLTEGKNREIKRLFRHFGLPLIQLHRSSFAGLSADGLSPGKYRRLRQTEVNALYRLATPKKNSQTS